MKIHILAAALATLCLTSLVACEGETPSVDQALKQAGDAAGKVSSMVENFDATKVKELANIAAELEKEPAKAKELLEKAGLSRAEFDKAVKAIMDNPEFAKIFEAAKNAAK